MDWKEMIEKFRLFDFQVTVKDVVKGKQIGLFNKIENNYNINMPQEMAENIINLKIDEALERRAKEMAIDHLTPIGRAMDLLSESTAASVVASTMATATLEISVKDRVTVNDKVEIIVTEKS